MRERIPSRRTIKQAEEQQAVGNYAIARTLVSSIGEYPLDQFPKLNARSRRRFLRAAKIHVGSSVSRARGSWRASEVANNLESARNIIVTIYDNAHVQKAAKAHEFSITMGQDKVDYLLTLAALTGNNVFISQAISEMDSLIKDAEEPTEKTQILFDRQQLIHRQIPTPESFASLSQMFELAIAASIAEEDWEQTAAIATQYNIEATNMGSSYERAALHGEDIYNFAASQIMDPRRTLANDIEKDRASKTRQLNWQKTKQENIDYSYLALPSSIT